MIHFTVYTLRWQNLGRFTDGYVIPFLYFNSKLLLDTNCFSLGHITVDVKGHLAIFAHLLLLLNNVFR